MGLLLIKPAGLLLFYTGPDTPDVSKGHGVLPHFTEESASSKTHRKTVGRDSR
jgi:hypothetical protein